MTRLAAVCSATAICASGSAAAAAPRATLTGTEYRQLATATAALNSAASAKSLDWTKARAACRQVGSATALLRTQRATCLGTMNVLDALASFPAELRRCSATTSSTTSSTTAGTTTTGTTTTGTITTGSSTAAGSAVIRLMLCMKPRYQGLGHEANVMYSSDIAARKQALARGFRGACLATLAPTANGLRTVRRFAFASRKLSGDVGLLIEVTQGKAPGGAFNQARIDDDVKQFETSATAVLAQHGQEALSVCPHE